MTTGFRYRYSKSLGNVPGFRYKRLPGERRDLAALVVDRERKRGDFVRLIETNRRRKLYWPYEAESPQEVGKMQRTKSEKVSTSKPSSKTEHNEERVRELVERYGIVSVTLHKSDYEPTLMVTKRREEAKKHMGEMKSLKKEIERYLRERDIERRKKAKKREKEAEEKQKELEEKFYAGELPIEVVGDPDPLKPNRLYGDDWALTQLYGVSIGGYYSTLPPGKYKISALREWKDMNRRRELRKKAFEEARKTGKPVLIFKTTDDCFEPDCDLVVIREYAMPDGSVKTERTKTY